MAQQICLVNKGSFMIRTPKKSLVMSRMIVLVIAMSCGLYICSVSIKQSKSRTNSRFINIGVTESSCHAYGVDRSKIPYLHYPNPKTFRRAECACNPVRLFAILSMQRSGSGWFETLLNSHLNVSSNGEIFSVKERRENISSITMTLDRVYSLDLSTSASKNYCSAAIGFKWMLNQVSSSTT
ncbi:hypothetical protein LIER_40568 [Lithospermum erythrorhizon]|uniref:Sulfotransferase n=1 Tax=Lithospermum erythrorhizon TaxID=34254 RepID=A0AAV3QWN0_LITER